MNKNKERDFENATQSLIKQIYYIVHVPTGRALDLTFDQYQFETSKIPYDMGRPALITCDARDAAVRFTHASHGLLTELYIEPKHIL